MSHKRIIMAAVGGVAVLGFSTAPAFAANVVPVVTTTYPAAVTSGSEHQVDGSKTAKQAPLKVAAVSITREAPTQPKGSLAFTGSDAIIGGLVLGSGLVVVGGGLIVGGRRKRTTA